jgi:hypothetical protein
MQMTSLLLKQDYLLRNIYLLIENITQKNISASPFAGNASASVFITGRSEDEGI